MSLTSGTLWEMRASATSGTVNGAGFNPANANFPTNATATSATGDSPVLSSATYNFVAGDVGAWVYVKSGTNWTAGFYQIASVASNQATLNAAIGQASQLDPATGQYAPSTVAGCATTASPTGGTVGVDYSQQDTATINAVADFTATGSSTTLTSATAGFTPVMVGNIYHQTTTGTGAFGVSGWYEIVSYTNATTVVLDRTPNTGTANVACTGYVGGAGRWNALEDAFLEMMPAGSTAWTKSGTYVISGAISVASTNPTTTSPNRIIGYTGLRGDTCNGTSRPLWTCAANTVTLINTWMLDNLIMTGSGSSVLTFSNQGHIRNVACFNHSTTAARSALLINGAYATAINCEFVSQNGIALSHSTTHARAMGCYIHDSDTGISGGNAAGTVIGNIIEACRTAAITSASAQAVLYLGNTIYGREGKIGIGLNLTSASSTAFRAISNILYGLTSGIVVGTTKQGTNGGLLNDFFNNTTDATLWDKDQTDMAIDPTFTGASQITGTTATTSGSVLTQSGGDFSAVTNNVDYLHVLSGTGVTTGGYLITSHTGTTLTVNNALGTSSGGNVTYFVTTGHNFALGTNLKGLGFPQLSSLGGGETTGYPDIGAVQRQEAGGASGILVHPGMSGGMRG